MRGSLKYARTGCARSNGFKGHEYATLQDRSTTPAPRPPDRCEDDRMERVRIDKWLWAARFFKTRAAATEAVLGGHVQVGGDRVKPAKEIRAGDRIDVRRGEISWTVVVTGMSNRLTVLAPRFMPRRALASIVRAAQERRRK